MDLGLADRTVVVTGASGGLGRHIAKAFADEGANVLITYHQNRDNAEKVAADIGERGLVTPFDLATPEAGQAVVNVALEWTGRVDVLVNNAVVWGATTPDQGQQFEDVPDAAWTTTLQLNTEGALRLARAVAPIMRHSGWGRMVHMSSSLATDGMAGAEYYAAAKAALHGFSRSVAFSLGKDGDILTNVVLPGMTRTDTNVEIVKNYGDHFASLAPIGRLLDAGEVANTVVYLGSAANTAITGQAITATGGA